ncbi:hypothetical protein EMIHUDRAFT_213300 [Emiliania huxleyi CCMP1516]|uniref:Glycoside hydrolase family 5 domain-containing protein n=2 Tax=Emiliania huxleyi TaxID=2903 RepID=A0A0D3IMW5_EMIH1|nr:hypothetical protein EMIHUDRAFT_213300 [Emiliania huxleyi CCMP1516]EOD12600.1 hypothetical protein EMIHUDRAFT_213300 [Emiliania huxleyi CCMP1516]|eukprot:XP_005765029.1 hypothetical protein EMIHUDRAFT_213300 [Emiliania huxleyi CCMP1516]
MPNVEPTAEPTVEPKHEAASSTWGVEADGSGTAPPVHPVAAKPSTRYEAFDSEDITITLRVSSRLAVALAVADVLGTKIPSPPLADVLVNTSRAGGNSMRVWLHVEGYKTPVFDADGVVVATDSTGSLISDMRRYLRAARQLDILIFFVLWNGAVLKHQRVKDLFSDMSKLDSYIDTVLVPMVRSLRDEPALGGWDVINEPEGSVAADVADPNPCYDTTPLARTGAGWAQPTEPIPMEQVLRFVGAQAAAIHAAAPASLVTVGSWSELASSDALGKRNYYTDECLRGAVGAAAAAGARLDFLQVHSYAHKGKFNPTSPFLHSEADFRVSAPLLIGEFVLGQKAEGRTAEQLYGWAHSHAYAGAWGWTAVSQPTLFAGMASLQGYANVSAVALTHATPPPPDTCSDCSDVPSNTRYTCEQQEPAASTYGQPDWSHTAYRDYVMQTLEEHRRRTRL